MNKKIKRMVIILAILLLMGTVVFAGEDSLLQAGASKISSDGWLSFTLDLEKLDSEIAEDPNGYTVTLNIDHTVSELSVKEMMGSINAVTGDYTVTSSELNGIHSLHFTLYPGKDTNYTVTAVITGNTTLETQEDHFSFDVVAQKSEKQEQESTENQIQDNQKQESKKQQSSSTKVKSTGQSEMVVAQSTNTVTYKGSANNYLSALSVKGYDFTRDFNKTRDTYFVQVGEEVDSVTVIAETEDETADVVVTGQAELSVGQNKILVRVTAENDEVRIYRIYVYKTADGNGEDA